MTNGRCAGYRLGILMTRKFGTTGVVNVALTDEVIQRQNDTENFIRAVMEAHKKAGKSKLRFGAKGGVSCAVVAVVPHQA